ncbi:hypothetical protein R6Q59_007220 [Mikania micrantha]
MMKMTNQTKIRKMMTKTIMKTRRMIMMMMTMMLKTVMRIKGKTDQERKMMSLQMMTIKGVTQEIHLLQASPQVTMTISLETFLMMFFSVTVFKELRMRRLVLKIYSQICQTTFSLKGSVKSSFKLVLEICFLTFLWTPFLMRFVIKREPNHPQRRLTRKNHRTWSNICCWLYDKERNLYLVKRLSGKVEYYRKLQDFCTMPKFDLQSINNAMLFNPSKDNRAYLFAKFLKDQCEKDFPVIRTAKGRRFVSKYIIDPKSKKPWVYYKYPPPHTEEAIPVSPKDPDNSLANCLSCYFDEKTLSAVILRNKDDVNDVYLILDPMDLLKFWKEDIMCLHKSPIKVYGGWDEEAKPYTRMVAYAIVLKLYAGAETNSVTLPIG